MAKQCVNPEEFRKENGFSQNFVGSVRKIPTEKEYSKDQLQALARNLGVDDERALGLRDGKKHLFGRNLKDIEDFDPSKGKVPKDTIVRQRNQDGTTDYFISNRKTDVTPTKWVVDNGRIKPNPDWDWTSKNQTVDSTGRLKRYSRKKGASNRYVEDEEGDVLLKVGRIYEGEEQLSKQQLATEGYDAVKVGKGELKVISESHQAVEPESAFIQTEHIGMESQTIKQTPDNIDQKEISDHLESLGVGTQVAGTLGGLVAGEIADNWTEDDTGGWLGGVLGFALTLPAARNKIRTIIKGNDKNIDTIADALSKEESNLREAQELTWDGYRGNPHDEQAKTTFKERFLNSYQNVKDRGGNAWGLLFKNKYLQSGVTDLWDMGADAAKQMYTTFMRTETAHNPIMARGGRILDKHFGTGTSLTDFNDIQVSVLRDYIDRTPELSRRLGDVSDEQLIDEMGRSVRRIITNQAELDNTGSLTWKRDEAGAYDSAAQREKDAAILSDQRGQRVVDAVREMYDDIGQQAIDTYQGAINELLRSDLVGEPAKTFRNFYDSELSIKQWQKNVAKSEENGEELLALFNKHNTYKPLQEAIQFREKQLRIQSLQGRYVPQIQSMGKITEAKGRFLQQEGLTKASSEAQEEAWNNELQRRIVVNNREGMETLSSVSASGDNIDTIYAPSFNKMLKELRNTHASKIQNAEIRRQVLRDLDSGQPDVIQQYIGRTEMGGTPRYYVKNPEKFETNIVADMNSETKSSAARTYINMVMMKQSNHLDNPRNYILPDEFLNNNLNDIFQQYSRDVGVKLHLLENGMGTQRQLNKKIDGVISELRQKGVKDNLEGKRRRIEEWYAAISNTRDAINVTKTDGEAAYLYNVERRNNKIVRTIMNFGAMPFMWFTPFYAPFTPFILGPFQSSFKNVARSYRDVLKNPQALKSATDELYKTGVIEKKLHSMSAFMQDGYSKDALSGTDNSALDWIYNLSQKGINFSTQMSLTKGPLSKMGIDVENTGLLRLFSGNLYDISGSESALVTMSVMREVEDMVEAGAKIIDLERQGEQILEATGGGKTYRMGQIERQLNELGVDNPRRFIDESRKVTNNTTQINAFRRRFVGEEDADVSDYLQAEMSRIMDATINQYHGRTKLTRPLKWVNNIYGRMLSQFSVYSQNFGVQTLRRRMYQPLKDWTEQYPIQNEESLFKVFWHAKRGNDNALKRIFGDNWQAAYNDFPVDAVDNILKVAPATMGVGAAMMATREGVIDFIDMLSNEAMGNDDYEAWSGLKQDYGNAGEYFDGNKIGYDIARLTMGALHNAVHMGFTGRVGQVLLNESKYQKGLFNATPATQMINEGYNVFGGGLDALAGGEPAKAAKGLFDYSLLRMPVVGSFAPLRENAADAVFNKPQNRNNDYSINLEDL